MTIDEAVRALAEKMELKPEPWTGHILDVPAHRFWIPVYSGEGNYWIPDNPLESAECSERLLLAMLNDDCRICIQKVDGRIDMEIRKNMLSGRINERIAAKEQRMAIFLAALKWQGIEEPKEDESR